MRELNQILSLWEKLAQTGQSAALATVVRTEGSSYRLPGARLLVGQDGQYAGGISGGCLEDELIKKAWWLTASGPILRHYDTTADGEIAGGGYGLGCHGLIDVLLERVIPGQPSILTLLKQVRDSRIPLTIAHLLSPEHRIGERIVLSDAECPSTLAPSDVFLEKVSPAIRLLVFGAGVDAIPLTELASYLGWQITVLDGRAHYARADKFPAADQVVVRSPGTSVAGIDPWTAAVLMTHSYQQDLDILRSLSGDTLRYLGVLGPHKRTVQLLAELKRDADYDPALHSPIGLDLGGHGPEQVALAIVAEIQAVFNGRSGGFLRDRPGPIHSGELSSCVLNV